MPWRLRLRCTGHRRPACACGEVCHEGRTWSAAGGVLLPIRATAPSPRLACTPPRPAPQAGTPVCDGRCLVVYDSGRVAQAALMPQDARLREAMQAWGVHSATLPPEPKDVPEIAKVWRSSSHSCMHALGAFRVG